MKFLIPFVFFMFTFLFVKGQNHDSLSAEMEQYIDSIDPSMPFLDFTLGRNLSDVSVCKGPNSTFLLTGTTGDKNGVQEGIRMWISSDLKKWEMVNENGYVWTFSKDAVEWQKRISTANGTKQRAIIAPKLYFWMDTLLIAYTNSNTFRSGILKSRSGGLRGPFVETSGDSALINQPNISLFFDTDSMAYLITGTGSIFPLNRNLSAINWGKAGQLSLTSGKPIQDNVTLSKIDGVYYLTTSRWSNVHEQVTGTDEKFGIDARYDLIIAKSTTLFGPYTEQRNPIQHAGGGSLFIDFQNNLWATITGEDFSGPVNGFPAFIPLKPRNDGELIASQNHFEQKADSSRIVFVSPYGNNNNGNNWDNAYTTLQRAIENAPNSSQIWVSQGRYNAPVEILLKSNISIYGGFKGNETQLGQRNSAKNKVIVSGRNTVPHVFLIGSSRNIRIDGLTIHGGNASSESSQHQFGAGAYLLGGGETVKFVNCIFENNIASQDGGAVYASIGASPTFINCTFRRNVAFNNGGAVAVYSNSSNGYHTKFYNCTFDNNIAHSDGGAIYFDSNKKSQGLLSVINCLITSNTTLKEGGALTLDGGASLLMTNSTLCFNKGITQGASVGSFGRIPAKSRVYNSIFYQNFGESLFNIEGEAESDPIINNKELSNIWVKFENCLFEANEVKSLVTRQFDKKRWRTVIELNESVMGKECFSGNPAFIDPSQGNFRLSDSSRAKSLARYNVFKFNLDKQPRQPENNNIGCY